MTQRLVDAAHAAVQVHANLRTSLLASGLSPLSLPKAEREVLQQADFGGNSLSWEVVAEEWLTAVRSGPGDVTSYHHERMRRSGVSENSAVSHIHFVLCEAARLAIEVDQIDVSNLASFELLFRRVCQDETAVARNPRHPDYGGLDVVMAAPTSEQGQATTSMFSEWVTALLKEQASIYRQTRLWNEEQRAIQSARHDREGDGGKNRGGGRKKGDGKKSDGAKDGASPP